MNWVWLSYLFTKIITFFFFFFSMQKQFKVYNVVEDRRYQEIQCELLSPGKVYVVDVQASVNPQMKNLDAQSEWSEWSAGVECTCFHHTPGPYILNQKWLETHGFTGILGHMLLEKFHFQFIKNQVVKVVWIELVECQCMMLCNKSHNYIM